MQKRKRKLDYYYDDGGDQYNDDGDGRQQRQRQHAPDPLRLDGDDDAHDTRFVSVDMHAVNNYLRLYDRDSDIQTFSTAALNHALSGGILFTRKQHRLSEKASDWSSQVWSDWVRDTQRHDFCLGFIIASFVPHPIYGFEPTMLNMDRLKIMHRLDCHNKSHWRVYEQLDASDIATAAFDNHSSSAWESGVAFGMRRVRNIRIWCSSPPGPNGEIRSKIVSLLPDLMYATQQMQNTYTAERARAHPGLVSERIPQAYKADTRSTGTPSMPNVGEIITKYGNGTGPYRGGGGGGGGPPSSARSTQYNVCELMNAYNSDSIDSMAVRLDRMLSSKVNNAAYEQVFLEEGRHLVQQIMPEAPQHMLGFRQSRAVRVGLMFGLTLPALTKPPSSAASGSTNEVTKGGSKGKDDDGSNSVYFENFQRELKQRMVTHIRQMYEFMHTEGFLLQELKATSNHGSGVSSSSSSSSGVSSSSSSSSGDTRGTAQKQTHTSQSLREIAEVEVSLPGTPDEKVLMQLWLGGILTHKAFVNYTSAKHSIPLSCFEATPRPTLEERLATEKNKASAASSAAKK